jgi:hypothetical protein
MGRSYQKSNKVPMVKEQEVETRTCLEVDKAMKAREKRAAVQVLQMKNLEEMMNPLEVELLLEVEAKDLEEYASRAPNL